MGQTGEREKAKVQMKDCQEAKEVVTIKVKGKDHTAIMDQVNVEGQGDGGVKDSKCFLTLDI